MRITVEPSTGVRLQVWRERQLFHATRKDAVEAAQICLGVDLFEVIAELAELDLERPDEAEEANGLAQRVQQTLASEDPLGERPAIQREGCEQAT